MDTQKGQENQDLRDLIEGDRLNIINFLKAFTFWLQYSLLQRISFKLLILCYLFMELILVEGVFQPGCVFLALYSTTLIKKGTYNSLIFI